jgi:DNA-binding CsgD family transcriptional regulator
VASRVRVCHGADLGLMLLSANKRSSRSRTLPGLPPPKGLEAHAFTVGADDFVLLMVPRLAPVLPSTLTAAECDVARLANEGRSNVEIARKRRTSRNTVANQLRSIYQKLGISNRVELAHACVAPTDALPVMEGA